jgi:cytochrome c oxidase subunit 2
MICSTCHGVQGEGNIALNSPKLAGKNTWYLRHQIANFKNGVRGTHKDDTFGQQMAPMAATLVDDTAIRNVAAYIATLPDPSGQDNDQDQEIDLEHGQSLYRTCGTCHGVNGEGKYSLNAPRLAGQESWYMIRQLQNFKTGVRGRHKQDVFGPQMSSMSRFLRNDASIRDVVAYIGTLSIGEESVAGLTEASKETAQTEKTIQTEIIQTETIPQEIVTTTVAGGR